MFYLLLAIALLFFILLVVKNIFKLKMCVICSSVSLTWLSLLVLYFLDRFENRIVIGLLMGQSVVGIFYLAEKKVDEKYHVFRLPFLLTLTLVAYSFLIQEQIIQSLLFLGALWILFILLHVYRTNSKANAFVQKIIACCKDW